MIISRSLLLRMRNVADKSCRENQNTIPYEITFFLDNVEKYSRDGQATDDYIARAQGGQCVCVCQSFDLSVRTEQLSSHWTDFHEI